MQEDLVELGIAGRSPRAGGSLLQHKLVSSRDNALNE